ncbi:hypothetical protein KSP35_20930 [Aquihabitans sp. G128]|uniref:hypothetical protein n=1 Tax=Aquihabitans sp. G128 TaxID=2849779 RepID=UPI001C23BA83|nr:hypothetical protein [Aquihabitans sp. G128]QXC60757.1 hypothetical protein KSP35_20930 [Aquihabitans sp. G128]
MPPFLLAAQPAPAGGSSIGEVLGATAVALVAIVAVVALGVAHRRRGLLGPLVRQVERRTGLPAWSTLPVAVAGVSLLVAVWGYYWDVSWHIDRGRDPGAFANPAHWFIIIGLDGIAFAALLAVFLGDDRSPSAIRIAKGWSVPVGAVLLGACGIIALGGFPLDDIWHRLFGQDVTAWGPTHIQMIGGASLSTIGCWALTVEGRRAVDGPLPTVGRRFCRFADLSLAGALLIGLSTLQVEFDFGVPQFRLVEQPVLLALAAGIGLVAARIRVGRGGALVAAAFFIAVRGALFLGVGAMGRDQMHFPLYLAEAVLVELLALVWPEDRPLTFGAAAGLLIGTLGFAAEWAWSRAWMPIGWTSDLLPQALFLVPLSGVGAGVLGALAGRHLALAPVGLGRQQAAEVGPVGGLVDRSAPAGAAAGTQWVDEAVVAAPLRPTGARRLVGPLAWLGVAVAVFASLPMGAHRDWTAQLQVDRVASAPGQPARAFVDVRLSSDARDAVEGGASWFHVLTWQSASNTSDGGYSATDLVRQADGSYRTAEPVLVGGTGKTILRLHDGTTVQGVPIFLPDDPAIPAKGVAAVDATRAFQPDKQILQREARSDRAALERAAYVVLALVAAGWMALLSWGLTRLGRPPQHGPGSTEPAARRVRDRSRRPAGATSPLGAHRTGTA